MTHLRVYKYKLLFRNCRTSPSTVKKAKCAQNCEVYGKGKHLFIDLRIKVKHGGYLHSDQAKGSRREKSEIYQCWAGRNKNVIFIIKNNKNKQTSNIKWLSLELVYQKIMGAN